MNIAIPVVGLILVIGSSIWLFVLAGRRATRLEREQVARVKDRPGEAPAPRNWTSSETVSLLVAIGTLASALASAVTSIMAERTKAVTAERGALRAELVAVQDSTRKLLYFRQGTWYGLPAVNAVGNTKLQLDDRTLRGNCSLKGLQLAYRGTGPAVAECDSGQVQLVVPKGARILFTLAQYRADPPPPAPSASPAATSPPPGAAPTPR